ncbi:MAG: type IV pilus twitching motility protein PilT [Christensenellales bacterium]|jgi:twitching motility protein PilT
MNVEELLKKAIEIEASDLHITVGIPPTLRVNGTFLIFKMPRLTTDDTEQIVKYLLTEKQFSDLQKNGEVDCSIQFEKSRFRINAYCQRGCYAAALRLINSEILSFAQLGLPEILVDMCNKQRGLILVTGPTGSGKSTTLAAMIDYINSNRNCHIITLEDPIEYMHTHKKSIVNQREIGSDSRSFSTALRAALRQDPDVILVGEMRDLDTISIALTAAETGHLVLSTLHTIGAASTIDRMVDVFPANQQTQVKVQLGMVLVSVISQQLIPRKDGRGRVVGLEIMTSNPAIANLIREGKTHQINNIILTSGNLGMKLMDNSVATLYKRGLISLEEANMRCVDPEFFRKLIEKG